MANYQNTDDDLLLFFKTAASHLHKNGIFIFDSWYGPAVLADPPCKRTKKFENDRFQIVRNGVPKHITKKKFVHVYFTLNITDKHTGEKSTIEETHSMRYLFTDELEKFIRPNHMALIHREQWMTGFPPSDKTWYVTYVVKKL
ncbi:MAG: hypothetical protein HYY40_02935 [Bacteroidetes bacterium]|nr:hypothetical protein [Bacteroidota bacterium]